MKKIALRYNKFCFRSDHLFLEFLAIFWQSKTSKKKGFVEKFEIFLMFFFLTICLFDFLVILVQKFYNWPNLL